MQVKIQVRNISEHIRAIWRSKTECWKPEANTDFCALIKEMWPLQQLSEVTDPSRPHPLTSVYNSEVKPIKTVDVHMTESLNHIIMITWLDSTKDYTNLCP